MAPIGLHGQIASGHPPRVLSSDTIVTEDMPQFGRIGSVVSASSGLWVTDISFHVLQLIPQKNGEPRTLGAEGSGPGEFQYPALIAACGTKGVVVFDSRLGRLTMFDTTGAYKSSANIGLRIASPKGIACDSRGTTFIAGLAQVRGGRNMALHRFVPPGHYDGSLLEGSPAFPTLVERIQGDGGPLALNPRTQTFWIARSGPAFELTEVTAQGHILRRIPVPALDPQWSPRVLLEPTPQGDRISARPLLGAVSLMVITPDTLLSVSLLNDDLIYRFALFQMSSGVLLTKWDTRISPSSLRPTSADGAGNVFLKAVDGTLLLVRQRWQM